jgi:trehalose 6-phosphate synthase
MNLVAKEYVASRINNDGVLVLSEFSGAAQELTDALIVNPHDLDGLQQAVARAVSMSDDEMEDRMTAMRKLLESHDVNRWANAFLHALETGQ